MTSRATLLLAVLVVSMQAVTIFEIHQVLHILKESAELNQQNAPQEDAQDVGPDVSIELPGIDVRGTGKTNIVMVEFSDYQCPYCARFATHEFNQLEEEFVASGKLKYAVVNFPLDIHSRATKLASAAICAGKQGQLWKMHHLLFEKQPQSDDSVVNLARDLGIDVNRFRECFDSSAATSSRIAQDLRIGGSLHLTGTPSFAIGTLTNTGHVTVRKLIVGAKPIGVFEDAINSVN